MPFLAKRALWSLTVLAVVVVLTFVLTYIIPGDPARSIAGARASAADVARIRVALGLDEPFLAQFGRYVGRILTLDFGYSFRQSRPVLELILQRFPATLQLALGGLIVQTVLGLPLGVAAARDRGGRIDRVLMLLSVLFVAAPAFWVGYIVLNLFAFQPALGGIDVLPIGGYEPLSLRHLVLPSLTLGLAGIGYYARIMRASLLEELPRMYVTTARAKGNTERRVVWHHAVPNALSPVVTQLGLDAGMFMGGVVVVEQVFSWPGIGKLAVESIVTTDVPLILGTVLFATLCIVIANFMVDVANAALDPRIRASR